MVEINIFEYFEALFAFDSLKIEGCLGAEDPVPPLSEELVQILLESLSSG